MRVFLLLLGLAAVTAQEWHDQDIPRAALADHAQLLQSCSFTDGLCDGWHVADEKIVSVDKAAGQLKFGKSTEPVLAVSPLIAMGEDVCIQFSYCTDIDTTLFLQLPFDSSYKMFSGRPFKPLAERWNSAMGHCDTVALNRENVLAQTLKMFTGNAGDDHKFLMQFSAVGSGSATVDDITVHSGKCWRVVQGDMMIPGKMEISDAVSEESALRNFKLDPELHWPHGVVYYTLEYDNSEFRDRIEKAFADYHANTCIQFRKKPSSGTIPGYVIIREDYGNVCSSSVGMYYPGTIRLDSNGCKSHKTIVHEIAHTLGFHHEQARYDRDDHVEIIWDNIREGKEHNFKMYDDTVTTTFGTPYDYVSMMHYSKYAFAIDSSKPTIVAKSDYNMILGNSYGFTELDYHKVRTAYNCAYNPTPRV